MRYIIPNFIFFSQGAENPVITDIGCGYTPKFGAGMIEKGITRLSETLLLITSISVWSALPEKEPWPLLWGSCHDRTD